MDVVSLRVSLSARRDSNPQDLSQGRRFLRSVRQPISPRSNANASVPLFLNNCYFNFVKNLGTTTIFGKKSTDLCYKKCIWFVVDSLTTNHLCGRKSEKVDLSADRLHISLGYELPIQHRGSNRPTSLNRAALIFGGDKLIIM